MWYFKQYFGLSWGQMGKWLECSLEREVKGNRANKASLKKIKNKNAYCKFKATFDVSLVWTTQNSKKSHKAKIPTFAFVHYDCAKEIETLSRSHLPPTLT